MRPGVAILPFRAAGRMLAVLARQFHRVGRLIALSVALSCSTSWFPCFWIQVFFRVWAQYGCIKRCRVQRQPADCRGVKRILRTAEEALKSSSQARGMRQRAGCQKKKIPAAVNCAAVRLRIF